ncbi:hypothetical protein [Actinacidiphila soli]|uniref:hypothetical protein n=1 Tax=Actinacidiphila soli TaxID=2487275 RepID=UPI000FCA2CF4|nr:hypothetical protein [Actinacidiphila soli]
MPFVSNDLLQQLRSEISALRQQIANQQHAIDRVEQTAIRTVADHLNETRADVRRALNESRESLIGQLTGITADLATIRANTQPYNPQTPAEPPQGAHEAREGASKDNAHGKLLHAAAGISSATFRVHRDTWAFLVEHAGRDQHFHIPGQVTAHSGTVEVDVSGPSLVAALTSLQAVHEAPGVDPGTAAIAKHLYDRIKKTVNAVAAAPHTGDGAEPVTITIDDRAGASPAPAAEPAAADDGPTDDGPDSHLGD